MIAGELTKAGIAALSYHAGLSDGERVMVQQRWVQEEQCKVRSTRQRPCCLCVHTSQNKGALTLQQLNKPLVKVLQVQVAAWVQG